ncbi:MAG: radical SAM protein [Pseudomonadales bacterium]
MNVMVHPSTPSAQGLEAALKRVDSRSLPDVVNAELTNNCNLMCAKCPTYEAGRGRGYMSRDRFVKILEDIRLGRDQVASMGLSGGGEAILHPEVFDFIALARDVPNLAGVHAATNALGLTPEAGRSLLEAGLTSLKISLDTNDPKLFLRYNRVDGYEQVVENISRFFEIRKAGDYQCRAELKVTLYKKDEAFMREMREKWEPIVGTVRFTGMHNWLGLRGANPKMIRTTPCQIPWNEVQILWDGQITLCCFDTMEGFINMGNVDDISLTDYWKTSETMRSLRRAQLTSDFKDHPVCGNCGVNEYERDI